MRPPKTDYIDVYPVGWLAALQRAGRSLRRLWFRRAWHWIRTELHYTIRHARAGNWRAVRNTFNGYLAEHDFRGSRAGTGWTKKRALRDLHVHLREIEDDGRS